MACPRHINNTTKAKHDVSYAMNRKKEYGRACFRRELAFDAAIFSGFDFAVGSTIRRPFVSTELLFAGGSFRRAVHFAGVCFRQTTFV